VTFTDFGDECGYRAVIVTNRCNRVVAIALLCSVVCVATLGGTASAAPKSGSWSKAQAIEARDRSSLSVVSCPSTTLCAAVDNNGDVHFWKNGAWLAPQYLNAGGSLSSISCTSTAFCMAMSVGGEAMAYNGRSWNSAGSAGPQETYEISCRSVTFCAAVGANGLPGKPSWLAVYNGHSWSSQKTISTGKMNDRVLDVSCATTSYCVAVNWNGKILTYDGSRWATLSKVGPSGLISVSCVSASFCLAISDKGSSLVIHGDTWTDVTKIPSLAGAFAYSVSCASTKECVAIGLNGQGAAWRDGSWSDAQTVFVGTFFSGVSVSCVANQQCMAIDSKDKSSLYRWS
jgi:hypothetical protein